MIRWILLTLLCWLVFVITQIPASWGAYLMTKGNALAMSGVHGTLWQGGAGMASIRIDGRDYALGKLSWKLSPWSLLTLSPCAQLSTDLERQQVEGTACASASGSLTLKNTQISVPASLIQGLPEPTRISGQISAHIEALKLKGQSLERLTGNLSWTGARLHNGQAWLNLGAFAADLSATDKGEIQATIFSLDGPIDLQGQVIMPLTGGIHIDGNFALADQFAQEVQASQWLPLMAEPLENGRHRIRMTL